MHIVIPMSGSGQRFLAAGYKNPKPLIEVDGFPIIKFVCDLFPGESKFSFICNEKHLKSTNMREILQNLKPTANIISIPPHKKGPVYALKFILDSLNSDEEVIVNYCDFGTYWDYANFLAHTRNRNADGAVVAYKGFHPHNLGSTNYAFMRESNNFMLEIKEKQHFTDNKMNEFASNGTYYFRSGELLKKYANMLLARSDLSLNGEFYVSLIYELMAQDGLKISIYEIEHMLQWGTPQDLQEYQKWSDYFREILSVKKSSNVYEMTNIIAFAGAGERFKKAGFDTHKPLLKISGKPMVIQATECLPNAKKHIFITQKHILEQNLAKQLNTYSNAKIITLANLTNGQATTIIKALDSSNLAESSAIFIAPSDNAMLYNEAKFKSLVESKQIDAIVFAFKNHPHANANPKQYGWIESKQYENFQIATKISVKEPLSKNIKEDFGIVGSFYFKKVSDFRKAYELMVQKDIRVNGEFYVDSLLNELIALDKKIAILQVDFYICFGTPDDYHTFYYWQSFFHKAAHHPYSIDKDSSVAKEAIPSLKEAFYAFKSTHNTS